MKLHWSPKSPYVRKVMICARELGLVERLELVRSVAAMLKPNARLMQDNPLSKIPALVLDDGFTLFDSVVICEYLNDLGQGTLFPLQSTEKWQSLRWHALGDGLLDALILWRNEREREVPLEALIDAFELKTQACAEATRRRSAGAQRSAVLDRPRCRRMRPGLSGLSLRHLELERGRPAPGRVVRRNARPSIVRVHRARRWLTATASSVLL